MVNLRILSEDMTLQGVISTTFNIIYNEHAFSCIFIVGINNHQLYITTVEENPHTIFVCIDSDFTTPNSLTNENYRALAKYLGFTPNPHNPFIPLNFFNEFDNFIPEHHIASPRTATLVSIVGKARNVPDEDKIYFVRWRRNPDGEHVSDGNYIKTCSIVGEETANNLRANNISSCWSDIPHDEQVHLINQYEALL